MTTVYLIRHCESADNDRKIYQGSTYDPLLSKEGKAQSLRLPRRFARVHLSDIRSGPLRRQRESAEPLAKAKGLELRIEPKLTERGNGILDGISYAGAENPYQFLYEHPEIGESLLEAPERGRAALQQAIHEYPDGTIALISSAVLISLICNAVRNEAPAYRTEHILPNGGFHKFKFSTTGVLVHHALQQFLP